MQPRCRRGCKLLLANDPKKDKAAAFLWPFLSSLWNFAAERIGEAANDAPSIDQAMRAGFNWELGPFEMWDAAGVRESVSRMKAMGIPVSKAVAGAAGLRAGERAGFVVLAGRAAMLQPDDGRVGADSRNSRGMRGLRIIGGARGWSGAIREPRWWILATALAASNCTR